MRRSFVKATVLVAVLVLQAVPAAAQGFLQQLFGLGNPAPAQPTAPSAPLMTPGGRPYAMPGALSYGNAMSRRQHNGDDDEPDQKSGTYRTICVRLCDGYYFPISNTVSKRGFYRDGMKCRAQCGDDARVFYLPAKTTDVDTAVDLQGRQYSRLNTAYVYRKTLVAGCQCKPDPWSETELARHQRYADAEQEKKLASLPKTDTAADVASDSTTAGATADGSQVTVEMQPVAKPKNTWRTTTTRPTPKPVAQRVAAQPPAPKPSTFGVGMGLSGGQMTWPGDTPRRP